MLRRFPHQRPAPPGARTRLLFDKWIASWVATRSRPHVREVERRRPADDAATDVMTAALPLLFAAILLPHPVASPLTLMRTRGGGLRCCRACGCQPFPAFPALPDLPAVVAGVRSDNRESA